MLSVVRPSIRPLTPISRGAISPHSVDGFQLNTQQMFTMWVGIAVRFHGHRPKVKITARPKCTFAAEAYILMVCCFQERLFYIEVARRNEMLKGACRRGMPEPPPSPSH